MSSELERRIQDFCSRIMVRPISTRITASFQDRPLAVIVVEGLVLDEHLLVGARMNGDGLELIEVRQLREDPSTAVVPLALSRVKFLLVSDANKNRVRVDETIIRLDWGAREGLLSIYGGIVPQGSSVTECELRRTLVAKYVVPAGEPAGDDRFTASIDLLPLP